MMLSYNWIGRASAMVALLVGAPAQAALLLSPNTNFGGGDAWLAPGEVTFLTETHHQRGLAYNPATNHVYVTDRSAGNNVHVLDGDTGALVTSLDMTGVTGGTFAINMIDVADDGAIYAGNLAIGANFKIYRWADNTSAPTVAFDALTGVSRVGDTLAVIGSGADTRIIASGSGHDAIAVFDTGDGANYSLTSADTISGVSNAGFRLGLDFIDSGHAIGMNANDANLNVADLATGNGEIFTKNADVEAPVAYYGAGQLMATISISDSQVRLYDASDLSLITSSGFLDIATTVGTHVANGNGTGDLAFGVAPDGTLRLYALNTNNGIQAFIVVPEPATWMLAFVAAWFGVSTRRRRRSI